MSTARSEIENLVFAVLREAGFKDVSEAANRLRNEPFENLGRIHTLSEEKQELLKEYADPVNYKTPNERACIKIIELATQHRSEPNFLTFTKMTIEIESLRAYHKK